MSENSTHFMGERLVSSPPNTLFRDQPGYQRPDPHPDDAYQPRPVTARALPTNGTVVERSYAAILHARDAFQKHVDQTNQDQHRYSAQGYNEQIAAFKGTDAARAVDTAIADVRSRRDQAQADANRIRGALIQPGDAAQESRNSRFWQRTLRTLDSVTRPLDLTAFIDEVLANASQSELGVLLEELGPYVKSRIETLNITEPKVKNRILDGYTAAIESAVVRVAPQYADAKTTLRKAEQALTFVENAGNMVRKGFDDGRPPNPEVLAILNPSTAGRLPTDMRGTLPATNGGKYNPDL
jgi:hypothetical protein